MSPLIPIGGVALLLLLLGKKDTPSPATTPNLSGNPADACTGLDPGMDVLLALTLLLSALTFSGPRTTLLEGAAHLVVFCMYIVLIFNP